MSNFFQEEDNPKSKIEVTDLIAQIASDEVLELAYQWLCLVLICRNIPVFTNGWSETGIDRIGGVVVGGILHKFQIFEMSEDKVGELDW